MAIIDLEQLKSMSGALIGLDPGTKTLAIAVSDVTRLIATPVTTIQRKKFTQDAQQMFEIFDAKNACAFVMGLPVNMDGSHGPRTQSVRDFVTNLTKIRDVPVFLWDERLSSMAVERTMIEGDLSRKKRAEKIDKMAAAYILQGVLDRMRI